jgi:hypothetical protein
MPSDYDNDLLRQAIIHLRANELTTARRYLERALEVADDWDTRVQANFYLSQVTDDPMQKRKYLEDVLAISPTHAEARKALAILDGKLKPEDIVNPDNLPTQSTETQNAKADRFTCPKCGARMVFSPDGRSLYCESCTRNQTLSAKAPDAEQDFILAMATGKGHRKPVATQTFNCQGCGAQFILPPQVISETCAYCGSVHVVKTTRELLEPDSIVPMAFGQRDAALRLVKWVEKNEIKPEGKVQAPRGIYLPIWTFDIMGNIPWNGTIYRNKQTIPVSGEEIVSYDDIVVYGTPKLADLMPKIIQGFTLSGAPAYDSRYLAGWPAEVNATTLSAASLEARKQAVLRVRASIRMQMGHVSNLGYATSGVSITSFKLALIPVWVTEYPLEGHAFRVLINGQSGQVHGETPSRGVLGWLDSMLGG